jgi:hypothetical protein
VVARRREKGKVLSNQQRTDDGDSDIQENGDREAVDTIQDSYAFGLRIMEGVV